MSKRLDLQLRLRSRSRITNAPLRRANGNSREGRRVRDLLRAYLAVAHPSAVEIVTAGERL